MAGLSRTATDMATTGAVTADSPAGTNRPAVPESRNTEPTRLKASLRASNTRTGERRRTAPHPANTRRSQASHPTSQAARTASPTPTSRRSANSSPFRLIEEMLPQKAKNAIRGLYGIIGVAAIVLGVALLIWPGKTLGVAAVALGIYFVVSGVIRIVSAIVTLGLPAGWRILDILIGIMLSVGGVLMLKNAALSGQALAVFITMVVGLGWMMEGVMALAESWRLPSSGWAVLYAIISIIAGLVVLVSPVSSMLFLVIFCGCALIVMGVSSMVRAFKFGRPRRK